MNSSSVRPLFGPRVDSARIAAYEERVFQRPLGDKTRNLPSIPVSRVRRQHPLIYIVPDAMRPTLRY